MRQKIEVADIFRRYGAAFRAAQGVRLSIDQRRAMAAIEACRTAALGGHVEQCEDCGEVRVSYNSCRNRHCPKCQGLARAQWLADRRAELLPVPYFHVVFTVPAPIAAIALQNKALVYDILFKAASETIRVIAADPRHLGAETGMIAVLHTWGQTLTHHPHVHCIVPGGGLGPDGRWVACRPGFFLPVPGTPPFVTPTPPRFSSRLTLDSHLVWRAAAKRPFGGARQVLDYLGRYTHRVAIANGRLLACDDGVVRFRWKDYRANDKSKAMTLDADEFMRRFLLHVLPKGFRRIRHFGFLANTRRAQKLAHIRAALDIADPPPSVEPADYRERYAMLTGKRIDICPCCGGRMVDLGPWPRPSTPRHSTPRCDTS
ncbi:IS91 family transposase [Methylosinus sp. PW1]|uniref:IS91 family transposase n=1 Tax=Methylosinus sp. PW1 TaxID=107636 RepID=UPI00055DC157|nr:IS91 family transposase [Methylosinus sp. PW1]